MSGVSPISPSISIDKLISIVEKGGKVRTGIDIFSKSGTLLLEKDALVEKFSVLARVKKLGVTTIPIIEKNAGGVWDANGEPISLTPPATPNEKITLDAKEIPFAVNSAVMHKIQEIEELKRVAAAKYKEAKKNIKKIILQIIEHGGEFDVESVEETVNDLFAFINTHNSAFSYLTREIFSYDDYLYNHSINVCTMGTAIIKTFNEHFSSTVSKQLDALRPGKKESDTLPNDNSFTYYYPEELRDIAMGFFVHDIGKVLIDKDILQKKGMLSDEEFEVIKQHSTEKGLELLEKNRLRNPFLANISRYHHAALYRGEPKCYPADRSPLNLPPYVKICKLADIYDAMTSRRCYKEAYNPVTAVAEIFHRFAEKDRMLQIILHSFVKTIGIYPPGSVVWLTSGQLAYIVDGKGPTILLISDNNGNPLISKSDPIRLRETAESGCS